jgi:hypothetical protein
MVMGHVLYLLQPVLVLWGGEQKLICQPLRIPIAAHVHVHRVWLGQILRALQMLPMRLLNVVIVVFVTPRQASVLASMGSQETLVKELYALMIVRDMVAV